MTTRNDWLPADAFHDLMRSAQLSDGRARCLAVAVCDGNGRPGRTFRQGDPAHFYYEFEVARAIGVPCSRLEFREAASGVLVHGKSTFQYGTQVPSRVTAGTRLRFHHGICLNLAPGAYSFAIGLGSTDEPTHAAYVRHAMSDDALRQALTEHCWLVLAGSFEVQLGPGGRSSHLGSADLPGSCDVSAVPSPFSTAAAASDAPATQDACPTVFHVTHWKAGSQWIHKILRECTPERIVRPLERQDQFFHWPLQPGGVYPTVYVSKPEFERVHLPAEWRRFVVIRDLRDTLVSGYFSLKVSHPTYDPFMALWRDRLQALGMEDGLILLMDEWLQASAGIQVSWVDAGEPIIRYEDLLTRDVEILERALLDECCLPVSRGRFREVVLASRFERITGGRPRGQEDPAAHARKGIAGDWRNWFTDRVKRAFKARFGGLLVASGYERDLDW